MRDLTTDGTAKTPEPLRHILAATSHHTVRSSATLDSASAAAARENAVYLTWLLPSRRSHTLSAERAIPDLGEPYGGRGGSGCEGDGGSR